MTGCCKHAGNVQIIIFTNVALESHFQYLYTVTAPKFSVGGKINQLGYVAPHPSSKAFLVTGIRAITKSVDSELLLQNARWGPPKNGEFSKSWLMLQQAGISGLCEKFHLYRLEKLVAISKFLDSYCSKFMGGGQDNPAGLTSPPGGKINQPGYVAPRG